MAIKIGKEAQEGSFRMYKGIAGLCMVAVNPNKEELSALQGREIEKEPEYLLKTEDGLSQVRITFYGKTAVNSKINGGIELMVPISFIITNAPNVKADNTRCQVVDKYGRFAWATREDFEEHKKPVYPSGPANISTEYRKAYKGEEQLVNFLRQWLNVPNAAEYKNKQWVDKPNMEASELSLNMEALLKGDVKELKEIVAVATNYVVKAAVGIRTSEGENGPRQFQTVFTRAFVKNNVTDYSKLDAEITSFQTRGGNPNTVFSVQPLHEHVVEATTFEQPTGNAATPAAPTPWD